jgi:hypothetical protein
MSSVTPSYKINPSLAYSNANLTITSSNTFASPIISTSSDNSLHVKGNAEFDGDIKWKGRSLENFLESIEKRLAILTPDPNKLEKFESLQKAYNHYKLLESLCETTGKNNES